MRKFQVDGQKFTFNTDEFNSLEKEMAYRRSKKEEKRITRQQIQEEISSAVHLELETIRKWEKGSNGPADMTILKSLADFFEVDYRSLLCPVEETAQVYESCIPGGNKNEKEIILKFHEMLTDYIYNYIGDDCSNGFEYRSSNEPGIVRKSANDYLFNMFRLLEKISLNISLDTYRKLRLLLMECKSLSMVGCDSRTPDVRFIVTRWIDANPILESLIYLSQNYCYIDELKEHDKDVLMDEMQLGVGRENEDFFMFETYDAFPMELAKALTSLFRLDFKDILNEG